MTKGNGETAVSEKKPLAQKMLDGIERVGNKVPHPVLMFLYLIIIVIFIVAALIVL